jgi:hypothetical protein
LYVIFRDPISSGFSRTVPVLWVLKFSLQVHFRTPNAPLFFQVINKFIYIYDDAYEIFDFPQREKTPVVAGQTSTGH